MTEKVRFDTIYLHMSNLATKDDTVLDELPLRDKVRPPGGRRHYWGSDYPYNKVHRFIASRVGQYWNDVFSEFCHLDWVPRQYKTKEQISHTVELNTFLKDGKVWYYSNGYMGANEYPVEDDNASHGYYTRHELYYVHPKTGILCFRKRKKSNFKKQRAEETAKTLRILGDYHQLIKLDGLWCEVKAKPVESDIIEHEGLHYRKVKSIPQPETSAPTVKFFGRKVVAEKPTFKVIKGMLVVPVATDWRYSGKTVGPRDRLMDNDSSYYWNRLNYNSIKITLCRQLNKKELKKYGLANDKKAVVGKRCQRCGGENCKINHNPIGTHMKK